MAPPPLPFPPPPPRGSAHDNSPTNAGPPPAPTRPAGPPPRDRQTPVLRMTRGAREAATGMGITDADVQRCLDAPDDVSPHPDTPARTRFRRGSLVVLAGADGMVLRVSRRNR